MIETERLLFRKFADDDLELLVEQRSDPDVNRYLGGPARQNRAAIEVRMKFYQDCYERFGIGMCAMIWKETGKMIGSAGIQPLENTGEIEVGYSIIKEYWGRGIGTEAARGWLKYGFEAKGLDRIVAVAHTANTPSRHIMEKLGMRYELTEVHYDEECAFYAISRNEFLSQAV